MDWLCQIHMVLPIYCRQGFQKAYPFEDNGGGSSSIGRQQRCKGRTYVLLLEGLRQYTSVIRTTELFCPLTSGDYILSRSEVPDVVLHAAVSLTGNLWNFSVLGEDRKGKGLQLGSATPCVCGVCVTRMRSKRAGKRNWLSAYPHLDPPICKATLCISLRPHITGSCTQNMQASASEALLQKWRVQIEESKILCAGGAGLYSDV